MTSAFLSIGRRTGAPLFYAGWVGFALFGTAVFLDGHADLGYAVFHVVVAAAICGWYAMTSGRAAPVVGAVLGTLFLLQMGFFLGSELISDESTPVKTIVEDALGLLAAVLLVVGAVLGLLGRRVAGRVSEPARA